MHIELRQRELTQKIIHPANSIEEDYQLLSRNMSKTCFNEIEQNVVIIEPETNS